MLYDLSYYYQKARESGISDLNAKCCYSIYNPVTKERKSWPDVRNHYEYIDKCYTIAKAIPIEELKEKFHSSRFDKEALRELSDKVIIEKITLAKKDLNNMMGYTPITHMSQQLDELLNNIYRALESLDLVAQTSCKIPTYPNKRKSFIAKLFKRQ